MMNYLQKIIKNRHLIAALVRQDMLSRYRRSKLGILWSVLMPLGVSLIIGMVYSVLWQIPIAYFLPFLFSGLTPWNFISECCNTGSYAYISAEGYIRQLPVDLEIFPVRVAFVSLTNFGFSLLAFFTMVLLINPGLITFQLFLLIPATVLFFIFGVGLSTVAATAQVYFRDYAPMQSLVLQALFYVTPILYSPDMLESRGLSWVFQANPLYYFLQIMRNALLGDVIRIEVWGFAFGISIATLLLAILLVSRTRRKIIFKL